jgi:hypothetical protein
VRVPDLSSAVGRAAALVAVEGLALLAAAAVYVVRAAAGDAESTAGSGVGALLLAGCGVLLVLGAAALAARRRAVRSPLVVAQLLFALTALSLLQTLPAVAVAVLVVTGAVLYLLATAEARLELGP